MAYFELRRLKRPLERAFRVLRFQRTLLHRPLPTLIFVAYTLAFPSSHR